MYLKGAAQFPFGHGLSYTTFSYGNLQLSTKQVASEGKVTLSVEVENTGTRAGDEVVQLYVHAAKSNVARPAKKLRGFQRVHLERGEKRQVSFTLPAAKLSFYDITKHGFQVEAGMYDILVGSSSEDIRVKDQLEVRRQ